MSDPVPYSQWKPDGQAIAFWLRSRTGARTNAGAVVDQGPGNGSFTDKTVETDARVEGLVEQESPEARVIVGEPCPASLSALAAKLVGYRVCAVISADGRNGRTEPDWWTDQADRIEALLSKKADEQGSGNEPGPADDAGLMAGSFPVSPLSVVGCDGYLRPRAL